MKDLDRRLIVIFFGMLAAGVSGAPPSTIVSLETICYVSDERPPCIHTYVWSPERGWELRWLSFDADGDWHTDTILHFINTGALRPEDRADIVSRGGRLFDDSFWLPDKSKLKLHPKKELYRALENDEQFRTTVDGTLRLLSVPLPDSAENLKVLEKAGYKAMIERIVAQRGGPPQTANPPSGDSK